MGTRNYWLLLFTLLFCWVLAGGVMVLAIFAQGEPNLVTGVYAATLPATVPGGLIWVIYTLYIAYRHLPKVDRVVDPEGADRFLPGDILSRVHRTIYYYSAITSERFNTKVYPGFDFKSLPSDLQFPLKIYGHWLILTGFSFCIALIAMKWADYSGVMPAGF